MENTAKTIVVIFEVFPVHIQQRVLNTAAKLLKEKGCRVIFQNSRFYNTAEQIKAGVIIYFDNYTVNKKQIEKDYKKDKTRIIILNDNIKHKELENIIFPKIKEIIQPEKGDKKEEVKKS